MEELEQRILGKEETAEETKVLDEVQAILDKLDLKIVSTKPKPRPH